jgi:hypothetical protein
MTSSHFCGYAARLSSGMRAFSHIATALPVSIATGSQKSDGAARILILY